MILLPKGSLPRWVISWDVPPSFVKAPQTFAGAPPTFGKKLSTCLIGTPEFCGIKSIKASPMAKSVFINASSSFLAVSAVIPGAWTESDFPDPAFFYGFHVANLWFYFITVKSCCKNIFSMIDIDFSDGMIHKNGKLI